MNRKAYETQMAKMLSKKSVPFRVISPPDWQEPYIKKGRKLKLWELLSIWALIVAALVVCSVNI